MVYKVSDIQLKFIRKENPVWAGRIWSKSFASKLGYFGDKTSEDQGKKG